MAAGRMTYSSDRRAAAVALAGFGIALAIRIAFLARLAPNFDFASYEIVAKIVERGGDFYRETSRYNYSPLWAFCVAGMDAAGRALGFSLARAVTSLLLVVDAATAVVLYRILRARGRAGGLAALGAALFFANPVSILCSSHRGMFDDVAIFFLVLAALEVERARETTPRASLAAGASLLVKHVGWFHPLLLPDRNGKRLTLRSAALVLLPYALFLASFIPYAGSAAAIRRSVFAYRSMGEPYGVDALRFLPEWGVRALFVAAALVAVVWLRAARVEFARASTMLFLVVLIFLPGVTPYYFVWPIALGALSPSAGFAVYTVMIALFDIHSPDMLGVELPHLPGWSGPWWAAVFWLLWEIRAIGRERAASAR